MSARGCAGSCNQGRTACNCACARWDGTSRETQPGELLPVTPDELQALPKWPMAWIVFSLVTCCAVVGYVLLPALREVL